MRGTGGAAARSKVLTGWNCTPADIVPVVRRRFAGLLCIAVCVMLSYSVPAGAARASSSTTSTAPARSEIARLVTTSYPGLTFGNVTCPPKVRRASGTTFTCTVQLPGSFLVVDALQQDTSGAFTLTTPQAVLTKRALEQFVAANASLDATVDCGPAFTIRRPGDQVKCTASLADGTQRTVTLTVRDAAGNVTITAVT